MTRAETAAIIAALETDAGLVVHPMQAPDKAPTPYVLVRPGGSQAVQDRLTGSYATHRPWWTVMAVGADVDECEWAVEHIDAALRPRGRGITPIVTGRRCDPVKLDTLHAADFDDDTSPPLVYQVAEYSYRSAPLPNPA